MGVRSTRIPGRLRLARMVTILITLTRARPTVTTDLAGFPAECLSASGPGGAGAGVGATSEVAMVGAATTGAEGATMEARGAFPGKVHFAVGSVTVTPLGADVATVVARVPSMAADAASVAAHVPSVEAGVPSEVVDVPLAAVDEASAAVDMPSEEAATVEAEAEVVPMAEGAGRYRHNSKLSRPTAFAVGRLVSRHELRRRERI
jgi:hypothetical protein